MDDIYALSYRAQSALQDASSWLDDLLAGKVDSNAEALEAATDNLVRASNALEELSHDSELVPDSELTDADRDAMAQGHPPYYRAVLLPGFEAQALYGKRLYQLSVELAALDPDKLPAACTTFECPMTEVGARVLKDYEPLYLEDPDPRDEDPNIV